MNLPNPKNSVASALVLAAVIAMTGLTSAGETVNKTLAANADGVVEIHNVRGDIEVIGWDKNEVTVSGELDDLAKKLVFKSQGNLVLIDVEMPRRNINRGDGSKLKIHVPQSNRVDINVVSTDINISEISGGVEIRTVSGALVANDIEKQLYIETVSGNIKIKSSSGRAKIQTVSGDIDGTIDSQDIMAESVSGDIELHLNRFDKLSANSVSGEVWIGGQLNDSGKLRLSTVNGDITLAFDSAVNARAKINVGPGGEITNKMSSDKVKDIFPNQQKLLMTLGNGSGNIKMSTVNGSIMLRGNND